MLTEVACDRIPREEKATSEGGMGKDLPLIDRALKDTKAGISTGFKYDTCPQQKSTEIP